MKISAAPLKIAVLGFALAITGVAQAATLVNGAGATFPYPLYAKWMSEYQKVDPAVQINYQSIGSGGGIRQLLEKTVDFGASDAPMTDEQTKKSATPILHIPTVLGAVVLTYNVAGLVDLKLDGPTVADIYLGKITKWNDKKIAALNAGAKLPDTDIVVTGRSDGSGTTNIFTDYLSKISPDWKSKVGMGQAVKWPVGIAAKGNEGVAGLVKQNAGAIGYVELIYAESNKLSYATMKNKAGAFVKPSIESVTAAADASIKNMPADYKVSITDADSKTAYPISSFTYLLVYKTMPKEKGTHIVKFLRYALNDGQKLAPELKYAPLPASLVKKVQASVDGIVLQ